MSKTKLSERVRPDCEAAPWVIEEIKRLEAALEAKAAPVGERDHDTKGSRKALGAMNAKLKAKVGRLERELAAHQRQQATDWQPSGADYDRSIHSNPDAKAWADFFVATFPGLSDKHELMIGWFANAMMAMHDYLKAQQAREVVMPERKVAQHGDVLSFQGEGWNACLDEFARLNGKEVGRG